MAPRYKLTYFDLRARAEPTRIVFAYAGVHYEDVRVSFEEWGNSLKNSKYETRVFTSDTRIDEKSGVKREKFVRSSKYQVGKKKHR